MHFEAPVPADFEACLEFAKTYREDKRNSLNVYIDLFKYLFLLLIWI